MVASNSNTETNKGNGHPQFQVTMHYKLLQSLSLIATNPATYDSIATVMAGDGAFFRASGSISFTSML